MGQASPGEVWFVWRIQAVQALDGCHSLSLSDSVGCHCKRGIFFFSET